MIEKTRVVKISKSPEEVKAIFEKAIREEDDSVVFPADYAVTLGLPDVSSRSDWPEVMITLEISEPRKPGRPKGSGKKTHIVDIKVPIPTEPTDFGSGR